MTIKSQKLIVLQDQWKECTKCNLSKTRTQLVWNRGNLNADLLILGESPGANEDLQGLPFIGKSGKLLDSIILENNIDPDNIYICNVCLCRPPNNRKPLPDEIEACRPRLEEQIDTVSPKIIVTLGTTAMEALLGKGEGITKRRGTWSKYKNYDVMITFHPSACLRNPKWKELAKQDFNTVYKELYGN